MANDYEELEWSCLKCTYLNLNSTLTCSLCESKKPIVRTSPKPNNSDQTDSNNNSNNSNSKKINSIKSTFNSFSNDVKNFIAHGLNGAKSNRSDLDDSVIEIDPKTNSPVSKTTTIDKLWTCEVCTFAANPDWNSKCEICQAKRPFKINDHENHQTSNPIKNDSNGDITVYDTSLNDSIYDYARIWKCKECTYINFERDKECELCLTNRDVHQSPKILNDLNGKAHKKPSPSTNNRDLGTNLDVLKSKTTLTTNSITNDMKNKNENWICKMCTYLNSKSETKCILCHNSKDKSVHGQNISETDARWTCETCSHKNKASRTICEVCANEKDHVAMDVDDVDTVHYDNNYDSDFASMSTYLDGDQTLNSTLNPSLTYRSHKAKSLIKQYTNATSQAERIWNNIVNYCKENNHKFVDDSFPPCDKSLFTGKKPDNFKAVQWLSPEFIQTHRGEQAHRWSVYNEPKFNDIKQGLAVILEQPELLRRIIITKDYCSQGCYQVRLCHNGDWQTVILDDMFPCDMNGNLIYSQASRKQLWVPLIEKAMAKLNGSYESLIAGQTVEGLSALTGYPCDSIRLEPGSSNEEEIDLEMTWVRLLSMKEAGYALGASCGRTDIPNDKVFTDKGLLPRHAYSVLSVKEIYGNRLIQLRNPWGRYTWTGDWSEDSTKWTSEIRKSLGLKQKSRTSNQSSSSRQEDNLLYNAYNRRSKSDEGVFWISFDDFSKYFCSIDICKTRLDWLESRVSGYFSSEGTREMQAFTLNVFETCEIDIGLFHKTVKNRRENSDLDLCFVVLKSNGCKNSVGKYVVSSKRQIKRFVGREHIFEPGMYIIVPCSFNFWYTSENSNMNNLYNLVVQSPKQFFIEQEMYAAFLLADTMIQLCLNQGSKTSSGLENAGIYTLAKSYSGLIVVAENFNEHAYLHVELDCERSNNVVSTRQALLTKDSIPPLHRQVLILLTQLESSSSYSIQYSIKYRLSSNPYMNTWPGNEGRMITNLPHINKQTFGLHAPRSVFD